MPLNIDWQQILLHLFNFVILFGMLYFLLYAPVKKFMDKRTEYYKNMDDEAKNKLLKADELKNEYVEKLRTVEEEIAEKRQAANKAISEKNAQDMLLAKQEAEKIVADAHEKAKQDTKKMLENAQNENLKRIHNMVEKVRNDEEVSIEFMKIFEREQMLIKQGIMQGIERGIEQGRRMEMANTARECTEKLKERQRAEEAEKEVARLKMKLQELQIQNYD